MVQRSDSAAAPAGRQPDRRARIAGLVWEAKGGSGAAIGQLVTEFSPLLWHTARAAGLNQGDAEDVLQTVWLRLCEHLDEIHTPAELAAWLVTTTRRESWRVRGAGRRQFTVDRDWLASVPDRQPTAEELAVVDDQRRELWAAVAQLSPRCQKLLRIVAFAPRPDYNAVAAGLSMPRGSIGPTRGRCLAQLRALLLGTGKGDPR